MAVSKKMIKIFLRLPTKHATKRPDKRSPLPNKPIYSVNTSKQNLPDKEPNFNLGTLALHNTSKTNSVGGVGLIKKLNKDLHVKPLLGLGFQT